MSHDDDQRIARYRAEMGKEPPVPTGPLADQWRYRGTKAEREDLERELYELPAVEVGDDQPSLFDEGSA